jgi:hypothetical protein
MYIVTINWYTHKPKDIFNDVAQFVAWNGSKNVQLNEWISTMIDGKYSKNTLISDSNR